MKTSKTQIQVKLTKINQLLGRPTEYMLKQANGGYICQVGYIGLDHNPIYGGYQLNETINTGGGVDDKVFGLPWGHRLAPKEMSYFLDGVLAGLTYKED